MNCPPSGKRRRPDAVTCNHAARITEQTLCRSFDAIHLASALRAGANTTVLTFDQRQALIVVAVEAFFE